MKNGVMMQYFEWNLPNYGKFWKRLRKDAPYLQKIGITAIWIPPACKAINVKDVGYGVYDLFDLGEFYQKRSVRTKYGTKHDLKKAIEALHFHNISVYFDAVMNHKAGADRIEKFTVREVSPIQREEPISEAYEIEGWTGFNFPGRDNLYSAFKWTWHHFTGVDYNTANGKKAIYQIQGDGKSWSNRVDGENGNYDYLMYADIDYDHPEVVAHMKEWGIWVANELNLNGMRLDALKHIDSQFIKSFVENIRADRGADFYAVGEYWKQDVNSLDDYLNEVEYSVDLFDVPLHYNLNQASEEKEKYDLRTIFNDTLVIKHPDNAVTFVDNHDSQKGSSLESVVMDWFKPLAYGLILLMKGGYPCVFYGDYYGLGSEGVSHRSIIDTLIEVRKKYAHGEQIDYYDESTSIGFVRLGNSSDIGSGLAFLISTNNDSLKLMNVGMDRVGEVWYEFTGSIEDEVVIDENGNGNFAVKGDSLAVWVKK